MSIFTRFRDIVAANLNAMVDGAEDPERLLQQMIQEMEGTLVELKESCAESMADRKRVLRRLDEQHRRADEWAARARSAVERGREDMAREALVEKGRYEEEASRLETMARDFGNLTDQYQDEIAQLTDKLASAREKREQLVRGRQWRREREAAESTVRRPARPAGPTRQIFAERLEAFDRRIREVDAGPAPAPPPPILTLEEEFAQLERNEQLENELAQIRAKVKTGGAAGGDAGAGTGTDNPGGGGGPAAG